MGLSSLALVTRLMTELGSRRLREVDPGESLYLAVFDVWGPISVQIVASDFFKG